MLATIDRLIDRLVISAYTFLRSITLTLATLQVIALPSRWVESAIALSVIYAVVVPL